MLLRLALPREPNLMATPEAKKLETFHHREATASIQTVPDVLDWAEDVAGAHADLSPTAINVMVVCLLELVANIALHASFDGVSPTVRVGLRIDAGVITLAIGDNGAHFDPITDAPVWVDTDLATARVGGRGLLIVRNLSRAMCYKRKGGWNCVRLEIA